MSAKFIKMLECFQGEVAKCILRLPKWYSNTAAVVAVGWSSFHATSTIRKLFFLHQVMTNEASICHHAFAAMADDVKTLSLVKDCRALEKKYKLSFTSQMSKILLTA